MIAVNHARPLAAALLAAACLAGCGSPRPAIYSTPGWPGGGPAISDSTGAPSLCSPRTAPRPSIAPTSTPAPGPPGLAVAAAGDIGLEGARQAALRMAQGLNEPNPQVVRACGPMTYDQAALLWPEEYISQPQASQMVYVVELRGRFHQRGPMPVPGGPAQGSVTPASRLVLFMLLDGSTLEVRLRNADGGGVTTGGPALGVPQPVPSPTPIPIPLAGSVIDPAIWPPYYPAVVGSTWTFKGNGVAVRKATGEHVSISYEYVDVVTALAGSVATVQRTHTDIGGQPRAFTYQRDKAAPPQGYIGADGRKTRMYAEP